MDVIIDFLKYTLGESYWNWVVVILCLVIPISILIWGRKNEPLINSIPGFCTSVGIMTTFLVLYWTLSHLDKDSNIEFVIKELSNKFSASLIGIFFSISYNLYIKIKKPYKYSKEPWKSEDPQKILFEMHAMQRENINNIEVIAKTHQSFKETVQFGLDNAITNINLLSNEVQSIKNDFKENIVDISTGLKRFLEESLTNVGKDSHASLEKTMHKMHEEFSAGAKVQMETYKTEMSTGFADMKTIFDNLGTAVTSLASQILEQNQNTLEDSNKNSKVIQEGFKTSTDELNKKLMEQADKMRDLFENMSKSFMQLDEKLASAGDELLQKSLTRLEKGLKRIEEIEGRHLTLLESVTNAFGTSVDQYGTMSLNQANILQEMDLQGKTMQALNASNTKLIEALNNNVDLIETIRAEVASLFNTVDSLQALRQQLDNSNGKN